MDGTSMAAPHVSGAAALLMARHRELIGQPAEVKRVLCETATDLGRERHYQGSGDARHPARDPVGLSDDPTGTLASKSSAPSTATACCCTTARSIVLIDGGPPGVCESHAEAAARGADARRVRSRCCLSSWSWSATSTTTTSSG